MKHCLQGVCDTDIANMVSQQLQLPALGLHRPIMDGWGGVQEASIPLLNYCLLIDSGEATIVFGCV